MPEFFLTNDSHSYPKNVLESPINEFSTREIIFWACLYGLVAIFGFLGNVLVVLAIVCNERLKNATNYFLINVALADITLVLFAAPLKFQAAVLRHWALPPFLCNLLPLVDLSSILVKLLTLVVLAIEKLQALLWPRNSMSKETAAVLNVCFWFFCAFVSVPLGWNHKVIQVFQAVPNRKDLVETRICIWENTDELSYKIYGILLHVVPYFLSLPFINVPLWIAAIVLRSRESDAYREDTAAKEYERRNKQYENQVIKMLLISATVFTLFWLPTGTDLLLHYFHLRINEHDYSSVVYFGFYWLFLLSSCLNPIIYATCNSEFGQAMRRICGQNRRSVRIG